MSEQPSELSDLVPTEDETEARFLRVDKVRFQGCSVTEGKFYKVERDYSNEELFENGEIYIIDDQGRVNFAFRLACKTTLYK
ncbi:hypothetical protein D3C87_1285150 [compost metagenome]